MSLTRLRVMFPSNLIILLSLSSVFGSAPVRARQATPHPLTGYAVTQREINEMAAPVELARRAILEETGLRQPNERLSAYIRRIALPLSGESSTTYKKRIAYYLLLVTRSAQGILSVHTVPALRNTSAENKAQWEHLVHMLPMLPLRVHKTKTAWQQAQKSAQPLATRVKHAHFDTELEETMQVILAASNGLRDARP